MVEKSEYGVFMLGMYLVEDRENVRVCTHTYAAGLRIYAAVFENVDHHSF